MITGFDIFVFVVLTFCILLGLLRGFIKEVLAILGWVLAFFLAKMLTDPLANSLSTWIPLPQIRLIAAFILIFFLTLVAVALLSNLLSETIKIMGLGTADRVFGVFFGITKAFVIVSVCVLLAGMTSLPQQPFWLTSMLSPVFEQTADIIKSLLPESMQQKVNFERGSAESV